MFLRWTEPTVNHYTPSAAEGRAFFVLTGDLITVLWLWIHT